MQTQTILDHNEVRLISECVSLAGFDLMSYSGRGMYGQTCLGLDVDSIPEFAVFLVDVADENIYLARSLANRMVIDTLGLGHVVYFPTLSFAGFGETGTCDNCGVPYILGADDHCGDCGNCPTHCDCN